jgi:hypothetical protein
VLVLVLVIPLVLVLPFVLVLVVMVVLGLRTGAVYEDEGAMSSESEWREIRHRFPADMDQDQG